MHSDLEKLLAADKINSTTAERLNSVSPGQFVLHKNWGAGKIASWDLRTREIQIDFEIRGTQTMDLKFALANLEPLSPDHFRAIRIDRLDQLKTLAEESPTELLKQLLESHDMSMRLDEVDEAICPLIVAEGDYKKWWDRAKREMREDHRFVVPSKRTDPLQLRDTDLSPSRLLISDYDEANQYRLKVKTLEIINAQSARMADSPADFAELLEKINTDIEQGQRTHFQQALELCVLRDDLLETLKTPLPEGAPSLADLIYKGKEALVGALSGITGSRQAKIYAVFEAAFGKEWPAVAIEVFEHGGPRAVSESAKFLVDNGQLDALKKHVTLTLSRHTTSGDALIWICRERKKHSKGLFDISVGTAILSLLEKDQLDDGPVRNGRLRSLLSDDKTLLADLIKDADKTEIKHFGRRLIQSPAFPELDRKSLMARIIKARPEAQQLVTEDAQDENNDALVVSWSSLNRKKQELEDIVKNRIPQNTKEISIARSYGDLRENFEFKAAKDMQAVLLRRKSELEQEIDLARGTDFKDVDTSEVSIGTKIKLTNQAGEERILSIMGAWDSDPEKSIVSYRSEIGNAVLGKKIGENVEIVDLKDGKRRQFTIQHIELAPPIN